MSTENPSIFNKRLGAAIRARRNSVGMTQAQVGKAIGVTFQQVQKLERGVNRLSVEAIVKLAKAIKTTPKQLIADASSKKVSEPTPQDRLRLEIVRRVASLPTKRQRMALNLINALARGAA